MKKLLCLILLCLSIFTCWAQNAATSYVERYKDLAVEQMHAHGIPASVVLAVAIHESGSGTSKIARVQRNHFGMKARTYSKKYQSSYKAYDSVVASYADFSQMLKTRKQFRVLFQYDKYDYRAWVLGMQKGRYAASKRWASQVIAIIEKYRLYAYDERPLGYVEPKIVPGFVKSKRKAVRRKVKTYQVKQGDTLSVLAKRCGTTVAKLQNKSHLKTPRLKVGQKIKLTYK